VSSKDCHVVVRLVSPYGGSFAIYLRSVVLCNRSLKLSLIVEAGSGIKTCQPASLPDQGLDAVGKLALGHELTHLPSEPAS